MNKLEGKMTRTSIGQLSKQLLNNDNFLIIQDIDGVCIPLVKDPLTRRIDKNYVESVSYLGDHFFVLTNGEHEGKRGVNRLIENTLSDKNIAKDSGLYLPGLAAGGVQFQNKYGEVTYKGVSNNEINFLKSIPELMESKLNTALVNEACDIYFPKAKELCKSAVIDADVSPTINLNGFFSIIPENIAVQQRLQRILEEIMDQILFQAKELGFKDSFFLHKAPNLGRNEKGEITKYAKKGDVGTTDIQFMIKGANKEAGLLVLINEYINKRFGYYPFGPDYNVRKAPCDIQGLKKMCQTYIKESDMPLLVGIGDTVTSNYCESTNKWLRGGSDRGFLQLIQDVGALYNIPNQVVLVDSSHGEVDRPSLKNNSLLGISDDYDPLYINIIIEEGPKYYSNWFNKFSKDYVNSQNNPI